MGEIDIAMCWDGQTPTAELHINGWVLTGEPEAVQQVFDQLNEFAADKRGSDRRVDRIRHALSEMMREVVP